ncbi:MAG TPA: DUF418 domain-containing protein [Sphingobium sp.]|uniref:DUF418 domain-containing protein n=1 Tax=Sphingobium sp. TaxID=1912891 RepID=UPI002ED409C0
MTDAEDRILPLDVVRGAAIIGVVLMNVAAIALPRARGIFPFLDEGYWADGLIWFAQFIFVDGKARALLAMLFGASTLLVIDRAEMDGRDGIAAQRRRLFWLLPIGFAHYALLWSGDILMLLAVGGLITLRFVAGEPLELVKAAFLFFGAQLLIVILFATLTYIGTTPSSYQDLLQREMVLDLGLHRDGYGTLLLQRVMGFPHAAGLLALHALPETLGFMMLGMAMAKGGFFSGQWAPEQYRRSARHACLVGLLPLAALGLWAMRTSDPRSLDMISYAASYPFRIPLAIGYAALLVSLAERHGRARIVGQVAAVGRTALSNYLLCSIVMTMITYGYGLGLYAHLGRAPLLLLAAGLILVMLLWSPLWLARFGKGPAERAWHALQRIGQRTGTRA